MPTKSLAADPYASLPDTTPLDAPTGEDTYAMTDKSGKQLSVPYSSVGRAATTGYRLLDRDKYLKDVSADPKFRSQGIKVTGLNYAGQPILGPMGEQPEGSAGSRLGSSFWEQLKGPVVGTYHALTDEPQTPEELGIEAGGGRGALVLKRMFVDPQLAQGRQAWEEAKKANWLSLNPADVDAQALAAGHALAAVTPGVGPATAQIAEKAGKQAGGGDVAGAAGTLAGFGAVLAAPEVGAKALRSEFVTRTLPRGTITRLIRPMKGDLQFGKDPAAAILDERIVGFNLEQIGDKVSDKLQEVGRQIDDAAKSPKYAGRRVNVSGVLQPLDEAIKEAKKAHDAGLYTNLRKTRDEIYFDAREVTLPSGRTVLRPAGPRNMILSPEEALKFKRMIGDRIRWTEDPLQGEVNKSLGASYGKVKDALNTAVPELKDLNERYANLVGAAKAIQRRIPVELRNAHWSLSDIALAGTGHIPMAIARKVAATPIFRTTWAQGLYRLPEVIPPSATVAPVVGAVQSQQGRRPEEATPEGAAQVPSAPAATTTGDDPYSSLPDTAPPDTGGAPTPFAHAISSAEGFGPPDTIPTRANNPGSLKLGDIGHGVLRTPDGQEITVFGSQQEGWNALDSQLNKAFTGDSKFYSPSMTLQQFGQIYSGGDANYGARLAASLGVDPSTTLGQLAQTSAPESAPTPPPVPAAPLPAPAPLPKLRAEADKRKPSPATRTAPPINPPNKKYLQTATGPDNHKIGTDDGVTWFDVETGHQVR